MAGNPYSGGPQIGGLYNANLQAALTDKNIDASERNATKRSFASLLSTGITAANTARVAEANRIARTEMNNARIAAQNERMREKEQIMFDNKVKFEQEKQSLELEDFDNFLDIDRKISENTLDPDEALVNGFNELKRRYLKTGDPRYAKLIMTRYGAETEEEVQDMIDGVLEPSYTSESALAIRAEVLRNKRLRQAGLGKAESDATKAKADAKLSEGMATGLAKIDASLDKVIINNTIDEEETFYFTQLLDDREGNLATKEGRKAIAEKKYDLDNIAGPTMNEIQSTMQTMSDAIFKLNAAGGTYELTGLDKAAWERIGGDGEKMAAYMASITEKDLIVTMPDSSTMSVDDVRKIKQDILTAWNTMGSRANLIGKSALGQTGVQTDKDWYNNMQAMFNPGQSPDVVLWHMEKGANAFAKSLITQAVINGSPRVLEDQLQMLHDRGWRLDSDGNTVDVAGVRYRLMDAADKHLSVNEKNKRLSLRNPQQTEFSSYAVGVPDTAPSTMAGSIIQTDTDADRLFTGDDMGGLFNGN